MLPWSIQLPGEPSFHISTRYRVLTTGSYLVNYKQSKALRELRLDHCYLTGKDIAYLLQSMTETPGKARELHLDVSENYIEQDLKRFTKAIAGGYAPSSLAVRLIEFEDEAEFRRMILAFGANNTIRQLDISRVSLPCDATEDTCQAMERMFADNTSLEWLDMSGEDSRLETTKLGVGINKALRGLQRNRSLRVLYIKCTCIPCTPCSRLTYRRPEAWCAGREHSC
jgi:hypothetical protein